MRLVEAAPRRPERPHLQAFPYGDMIPFRPRCVPYRLAQTSSPGEMKVGIIRACFVRNSFCHSSCASGVGQYTKNIDRLSVEEVNPLETHVWR